MALSKLPGLQDLGSYGLWFLEFKYGGPLLDLDGLVTT